jgi:hypothetical protein
MKIYNFANDKCPEYSEDHQPKGLFVFDSIWRSRFVLNW